MTNTINNDETILQPFDGGNLAVQRTSGSGTLFSDHVGNQGHFVAAPAPKRRTIPFVIDLDRIVRGVKAKLAE
jgi:hypothetical protein